MRATRETKAYPVENRLNKAICAVITTLVPLIWLSAGQTQAQTISMQTTPASVIKANKDKQIAATISTSQTYGRIGEEITATLRLHAIQRQTNIEVSFRSGDCLSASTTAKPAHIHQMDKGLAIDIKETFTVTSENPCWLNANVIRTKKGGEAIVYTAVYGATINPITNVLQTTAFEPYNSVDPTIERTTQHAEIATNQ